MLSGENQALLVRENAFLVLDLGLDIANCVGRFHFKGDRLASQGLDKDLHTTTETKDEVKHRLLLDVVIRKRPSSSRLLVKRRRCWLGGILEMMISIYY